MRAYKFEFARFQKSPKRKGIYDLIENEKFPFYFIKYSQSKKYYLVENNANIVIQSWGENDKINKILHTGLIHVESGFYFGNNINQKGKLDFIIVRFLPKKGQLLLRIKSQEIKQNLPIVLFLI